MARFVYGQSGGVLSFTFQKVRLRSRSDEELMSLWVESRRDGRGNTGAYELLWERHGQASFATIVRVLGPHRSLADDVLQDAWLEVARAEQFRAGNFAGWVKTIATRKALDRLASASVRRAAPPPGEDDEDPIAQVPDPTPDPARTAHARESAALLLTLAARLPELQRAAWTLRYQEGLTFAEVAEAMNTPIGTAKTRVRLADEFLLAALREEGIESEDLEGEG